MRAFVAGLGLVAVLGMIACTDFDGLSSQYGEGPPDQSVTPPDDLAGEDLAMSVDALAGVDSNADLSPNCTDGVLSDGETDLDCGGACGPCDVGRACLVDVDCQTGSCSSNRCELVSGPPSWVQVGTAPTNTGTAPIPRNDLVVELGPDGNLYAIAGLDPDGTTRLNNTEKLDQTALTWAAANNIAARRSQAASAATTTGIYLLYGDKQTGFETSVEKLTAPPNWSTVTGVTYTASGAGATFGSDGKIYIAGGSDGANALKALKAFTPGDANVAPLKDLSFARDRTTVTAGSDGRIFAIGGHAAGVTLSSVEAYTSVGDTWTTVAPLPEARAATRAVLAPDGRIYVPGGADLGNGVVHRTAYAYSAGAAPLGNRWAKLAPLAAPRYRHGVGVGIDGRVYVVSGSNLLGFVRSVEAYGPVVTVVPDNTKAGMSIMVSGSNFAQNATVRFSLGSAGAAPIGTGTTDGAGVLATTTVMIPVGTATGATRVYARDTRSRYPVSAKFTVNP